MVRKKINNINHRMDSEADPTKTTLQKKFIIMKEGFI